MRTLALLAALAGPALASAQGRSLETTVYTYEMKVTWVGDNGLVMEGRKYAMNMTVRAVPGGAVIWQIGGEPVIGGDAGSFTTRTGLGETTFRGRITGYRIDNVKVHGSSY